MENAKQARKWAMEQLSAVTDEREASAMTRWMLEDITGKTASQLALDWEAPWPESGSDQLKDWVNQIRAGRPFHYVMGYQHFCGHRFRVSESVLIPRPETEELVYWILDQENLGGKTIWDLGTGSGCIPISIKKARPLVRARGGDVSLEALAVARQNAADLNAEVEFYPMDMLDPDWSLGSIDHLISNPPYIPAHESQSLDAAVRDHEPHQALFVPQDDPLLFYRLLAREGRKALNPGGKIYLETHFRYAESVARLLVDFGYASVETKTDANGHPRMLRGSQPAER